MTRAAVPTRHGCAPWNGQFAVSGEGREWDFIKHEVSAWNTFRRCPMPGAEGNEGCRNKVRCLVWSHPDPNRFAKRSILGHHGQDASFRASEGLGGGAFSSRSVLTQSSASSTVLSHERFESVRGCPVRCLNTSTEGALEGYFPHNRAHDGFKVK